MRSPMRAARSVRLAAVLAGGAFALHQLRYLIAPSGDLGPQGHGYMTALLPPIAVLLLAAVIATLIRGTEGACPARPPLGRRVALFAVALLAIYTGQETLEGLMAGGGPGDLAAALTDGGWI